MTGNQLRTTTRRPVARVMMTMGAALALAWAAAAPGHAATRTAIKEIVVEEALATPVPPSLALAVAKVESDFQARALSPKGARGVMQIMPATAKGEFGVAADELWDARLNVQLGIDFLAQLIKRYGGRWDLALSHYNSGRVLGSGADAEPMPFTRKYVDTVLRWERRYANQGKVWRFQRARRTGWHPAMTRVARIQRPVVRRHVSSPKYTVRAAPRRSPLPVWRPRAGSLDDFSGPIEKRRMEIRNRMDDFAAGVFDPKE